MESKKIVFYTCTAMAIIGLMIGNQWLQNKPLKTEPPSHEMEEHEHHDDGIVKLTADQIQQLGISLREAGPGILSISLSARGRIILHPDRVAHIIPKVSGVAQEVLKNIGNLVQKNESLAILESREMADIKAAYLAALSQKRLATSGLEREEKLYQEKVSAGQDFLNAQNIYEEAVIGVQLAKQKLKAFGLDDQNIQVLTEQKDPDLRLYDIRSPIGGVVIARNITKGQFVENTITIYEVADLSTVWVEIGVYPKDLRFVKEGQMVTITIPGENKTGMAKITYVSPIVEEETITARAIAELENAKGEWRPGVFVQVNIATEESSYPIVIPKEALQSQEGTDFVFVAIPNGFEKRTVTIGQKDRNHLEVVSGLAAGEKYAADKTFILKAELGKHSAEHEH